MPLSVNVGLSKKSSQNYQSAGVSINVVAELDSALLSKPDQLQAEVERLYAEAHAALDRQASKMSSDGASDDFRGDGGNTVRPAAQRSDRGGNTRNGNDDRGRGNGRHAGNGRGGNSPATESQRRAINAIATRLGIDPHQQA